MLRKRLLIEAIIGAWSYTLPNIAITNTDRIWVGYQKDATGTIFVKYSDDGGETWSGGEEVGGSFNIDYPCIVGVDDSLHVIGSDPSLTNSVKYCKRNGSWGTIEAAHSGVNASTSDLVVTSGGVPYIICKYSPAGTYTTVRKRDRVSGSWGNTVDLTIDVGWQVLDVSATLDETDNKIHVIWRMNNVGTPTQFKYQSAYFDTVGGTWSSITTLDSFTRHSINGNPARIRLVGNDIWAIWFRDNLGTYTDKLQVRYAIRSGGSWGSAQTLTDHDGNHQTGDLSYYEDTVHLVYNKANATIQNDNIAQLIYRKYGNSTWSDETILTNKATNQVAPNITLLGPRCHIVWWSINGVNYDMYYSGFTLERYPIEVTKKSYIIT